MSTNTPHGSVLVPGQMQSRGTGFVPVQMQSGGSGSFLGSSPEFKRNPQALATVQIMVGVLLFMIDCVLCSFGAHVTVYTGAFIWAPACYIVAGSLTVAADRSMNRCMIHGSMGMNIVAAVASGFAIVFYGLDSGGVVGYGWDSGVMYFQHFSMMVSGVLVVCNVLVFCVSICVSAFFCKAVSCSCCSCCCREQTPMQAVVTGNNLPEVSTVTSMTTPSPHAPPTYGEVGHTLSDTSLLEFKRCKPQALGTVQIMVGALLFAFGYVFSFFLPEIIPIAVLSGAFIWAPACYIVAGSLTVAADRSMSLCMIKGSMGMNIVAAVMSGVAIIIYGIDSAGIVVHYRVSANVFMLAMKLSGVLVVFNVLVFCISISVTVFCCKAVSCRQTLMNYETIQEGCDLRPLSASPVLWHGEDEGLITT